jgi:hypothetical protein
LLLDKFPFNGEASLLQEAKAIMQDLSALAQQIHSVPLIIKALILQARFAIVEGNPTMTVQFLDQARVIAETKGLSLVVAKLTVEKQNLKDYHAGPYSE